MSFRFSGLPAYVSKSKLTVLSFVCDKIYLTKFEPMKPAPPVNGKFFIISSSEFAGGGAHPNRQMFSAVVSLLTPWVCVLTVQLTNAL
jgi:hypothetical protein